MNSTMVIYFVTMIVTYVLGIISKNYTNLNNKLIPIQNLLIGVIVFLVEWFITKEPSSALIISGLTSGGVYDIIKNLKELKGE